MDTIQGTAIIRERGQLTIPDKIRKALKWPVSNSVVSISTNAEKEIVIKPYEEKTSKDQEKKVDWDKIWAGIKRARSYKSKGGSLSAFVIADRKRH